MHVAFLLLFTSTHLQAIHSSPSQIDPHVDDALGRLSLTDQGLYDRDHYVLRHLFKRGIPVATVIGGGYSEWWDDVALRHSIVHRAATHVFRD